MRSADTAASPIPSHVLWFARSFGQADVAPFTQTDLALLDQILEPVAIRCGARVLDLCGEGSGAVYMVQEGQLEVLLQHRGKRRLAGLVNAGGVVGDLSLVDRRLPLTVVARTDARLLRARVDDLLPLLGARPSLAVRWLSSALDRLACAQQRMLTLTLGDLRQRVAALLAEAVADTNVVSLTQADIAALLGATRPSVNRVIQELVREGVIAQRYGKLEVLDLHRLHASLDAGPDRRKQRTGGQKASGSCG